MQEINEAFPKDFNESKNNPPLIKWMLKRFCLNTME